MNDIFVLPLKNSRAICIIDPSDAPRCMLYAWHYSKSAKYPRAGFRWMGSNRALHRFILSANGGAIDHKNQHKLDNTRRNLQEATGSTNQINRFKGKGGTSKYKGVHYSKRAGKWKACTYRFGKHVHLGSFDTEEGAALAYNKAVLRYHGNCAVLNEIK
jgi:hypothetical protein